MEFLINVALLIGILGASAVITQWFSGRMYNRCAQCKTLNAKRRKQCRACGLEL